MRIQRAHAHEVHTAPTSATRQLTQSRLRSVLRFRRKTEYPQALPAKSTIHPVLDRRGLVERRGRVRRHPQGTALSLGQTPNELWCTDYKGEFLLGNRQHFYPLTVTDHASLCLLCCEALSSTREVFAFTVVERLFQERGLPANIRNGTAVTSVCI